MLFTYYFSFFFFGGGGGGGLFMFVGFFKQIHGMPIICFGLNLIFIKSDGGVGCSLKCHPSPHPYPPEEGRGREGPSRQRPSPGG